MNQPVRAKKSGKNTRSSPSVRQNTSAASREQERQQPAGPQLFSLSAGFAQDAESAKPKDIDLFTIRNQSAAIDGIHISPTYTAPPEKVDVKPLRAERVTPRAPRSAVRQAQAAQQEPVVQQRSSLKPELQHTGSIPAYLAEPPARLPDAHRPLPGAVTKELPPVVAPNPVRSKPVKRQRDSFDGYSPKETPPARNRKRPGGRRRGDFIEYAPEEASPARRGKRSGGRRRDDDIDDYAQEEAHSARKKRTRAQHPRDARQTRKKKRPSAPPPAPTREEMARRREDAEIKRRKQHRKDRAAMQPVMDYMDGTRRLDVQNAGERPSYANMPKKKPPYVPVKEGTGNTLVATIKEERESRRKQEERLTYLIVGCVILFLIAAGFLVRIFINYRRSADEYAGLHEDYVTAMNVAVTESTDDEETGVQYPPLDINFASLYALNNDLVAWIYVPGCDISYPVVQGEDNDFYLNHTFLGTSSSSGAIFMDYGDRASFSDFNTFVYGHNMQDGSMFGALHEYWQDETLAEREPYFYIYLRNSTVHKYRICSFYRDAGDSQSYLRVTTPEEKEAYVQMILQKSVMPETGSAEAGAFIAGAEDTYVTLSTCQGRIGSGQRFLVHGYLVGIY